MVYDVGAELAGERCGITSRSVCVTPGPTRLPPESRASETRGEAGERAPTLLSDTDRSLCYLGSLAYSDLACWRMGMSGSASFHRAKKSW
jgi:hypothetical protein